jgi:AcrR family transcriptional regulator
MARPQSADHQLKREAILDAAARCFAQMSYPAASMAAVAQTLGASKARIYHYYDSKEALLYDLLDQYTQRLLALIGESEARAQRQKLSDRAALHALVRSFLLEYEHSADKHVALLNDTKFLSDAVDGASQVLAPTAAIGQSEPHSPHASQVEKIQPSHQKPSQHQPQALSQRSLIIQRQRDIVAAVARSLQRAYPQRMASANPTAVTMMLFGMINWTFTWLRPDGPMSYAQFADEVIKTLETGFL